MASVHKPKPMTVSIRIYRSTVNYCSNDGFQHQPMKDQWQRGWYDQRRQWNRGESTSVLPKWGIQGIDCKESNQANCRKRTTMLRYLAIDRKHQLGAIVGFIDFKTLIAKTSTAKVGQSQGRHRSREQEAGTKRAGSRNSLFKRSQQQPSIGFDRLKGIFRKTSWGERHNSSLRSILLRGYQQKQSIASS
jgi:hypothetical protein